MSTSSSNADTDDTTADATADAASGASTNTALWVSLIQAVLVMTWTVYVLFLPVLTKQAGIPPSWIVWILIADQAIFVVTDWASGVFADRMMRAAGRIGLAISVAALVSAGMLFAMPTLAQSGHREPLLIAITVWAVMSSFLRAPVFSLLGKIGGAQKKSSVVSLALVGVSIAGAIGPLITVQLQKFDPRWSLGAASLALIVAGVFASRVEGLRFAKAVPPIFTAWRPVVLLAGAMFVAAFGMQVHTVFGAAGAAGPIKAYWVPLFWLGFAFGLIPAARLSKSEQTLRHCAVALCVGVVGVGLSAVLTSNAALMLLQAISGAVWAVVLTGLLATAIERGGRGGPASPIGVLLSAVSLAAMTRLLFVALQLQSLVDARWWVATIWVCAAIGLLMHPWARRPQFEER